jgi:hypothetical protein
MRLLSDPPGRPVTEGILVAPVLRAGLGRVAGVQTARLLAELPGVRLVWPAVDDKLKSRPHRAGVGGAGTGSWRRRRLTRTDRNF